MFPLLQLHLNITIYVVILLVIISIEGFFMNIIKRILAKIGIIQAVDYNSVEYLRTKGVVIGENVDIINSLIDGDHGYLISIGNNVTITNSVLLSHDASTKKELGYSKIGCINIGDNVFIGYHSIVLPNVNIGNKVIIGAGTIVSKDVPDNVVIVGNPYKIVCTYDDYMEKHKNSMKQMPVYSTKGPKTLIEMKKIREELTGKIGYDL